MKLIAYTIVIVIIIYEVNGERKTKNDDLADGPREIILLDEGNSIEHVEATENPTDRIPEGNDVSNYDSKGIKGSISKNGRIHNKKIRKNGNKEKNRIEGVKDRGSRTRIEYEGMKNLGIRKKNQDNANLDVQYYAKKTRIDRSKKCRNCRKGKKKPDFKKRNKCPEKMTPCQEGQVEDYTNPGCCVDCVLPCRRGQELINPCEGSNCIKCPEMKYHSKYNSACQNCSTWPIPHYSEDGYKCIQCPDCESFKRVQEVECLPTKKGICSEECIDPKYVLDGMDCVPIPWQYYETFSLWQTDVVVIKSTPDPTSEQNAIILPKEKLVLKNAPDGQNSSLLYIAFMFCIHAISFVVIIAIFTVSIKIKKFICEIDQNEQNIAFLNTNKNIGNNSSSRNCVDNDGESMQSMISNVEVEIDSDVDINNCNPSDKATETSSISQSNEETELKQMDGQQDPTPQTLLESSLHVNPATQSMQNNSSLPTENRGVCIQASTVDSNKIVTNESPGIALDMVLHRSAQNQLQYGNYSIQGNVSYLPGAENNT